MITVFIRWFRTESQLFSLTKIAENYNRSISVSQWKTEVITFKYIYCLGLKLKLMMQWSSKLVCKLTYFGFEGIYNYRYYIHQLQSFQYICCIIWRYILEILWRTPGWNITNHVSPSTPLQVLEFQDFYNEHQRKIESAERRLLRAVTGYTLANRKINVLIRENSVYFQKTLAIPCWLYDELKGS